MIQAIIVDDEWAAGKWLAMSLEQSNQMKIQHILQNPLQLMDFVVKDCPDVVFLDIEMPEISGIELAETISGMEHPPEVIFVSAHNSYALEAFRVNALDYIVKPVHDREIARVFAKLLKRIDRKEARSKQKQLDYKWLSSQLLRLKFPTAKCEELCMYMLLKGKDPMSKWRIIEDLWPNKEPLKGESSIRTTVFRLNQTFEAAGFSVRIKAAKGFYHLIDLSRNETLNYFPNVSSEDLQESLMELLESYNLMKLLAHKDYIWTSSMQQSYENEYYQWAMGLIHQYRADEKETMRAMGYLLELFPWQEQLVLQFMPLLLQYEGKGGLVRFYRMYEQKWQTLYEIPLSEAIKKRFVELMD